MPGKKKPKAQSSLEYLLTYGWALVMIATIIGILVFAMGGGINTNACTTFLTMICKGIGADGDTLYLILQNSTGQKITINPFVDIRFDDKMGYAEVTYQGQVYRFEDVTISPGDQFTIEGAGMALADTLSITYYEHNTGMTRTITSNLSTDAPLDIELSNDGIDNDGDNLTDCSEAGLTHCRYVVETTTSFGGNIGGTLQTIQFGKVTGQDGTPLSGNWWAKNVVALAFYVESLDPGTVAYVEFASSANSTTVNLKQGWNVAEITLPSTILPNADIYDFKINAQTPDSYFMIANDPLTRAVLFVDSVP